MCGGPEQMHVHASHADRESPFKEKISTSNVKKNSVYEEILNSSSFLLELAANDDVNKFQRLVEERNAKVDEVGAWYVRYVRHNGTSQMVLEQRTPAMIAALYGSVDLLTYIMHQYAMYGGDIDQACGSDGSTALHCAATGGSESAVEVVKVLLNSGANVNVRDSEGRRPADVVAVSHGNADTKLKLEELLNKRESLGTSAEHGSSVCYMPVSFESEGFGAFDVSRIKSSSSSSALSTASGASTLSISLSASSSPKSPHAHPVVARGLAEDSDKAREYAIDMSLPDIKNTYYTSDEFRMYSFKIRPCSRAYSHDWTECPFAHPGENARRRDPRRYHYSCVPCPDFRKGACSQGDACEYAHGVFECWLHPAQYRTRLCKDGVECNRKVCFFAHMPEELRPVYVSTGSGLPSPMSAAFTDMSCMSPPLAPCSPSVMPQYSPLHPLQSTLQGSLRTPPMSPSSSPANAAWSQPSIPTLHLPGASLQASRLRAAFTARDVSANSDFDEQLVSEFQSFSAHSLSAQARVNAAVAASGNGSTSSRGGRYKSLGLAVAPANLEELFAMESRQSPGLSARDVPPYAQYEQASPRRQLLHAHAQGSAIPSPRESFGSLSGASMCKGSRVEGQGISKGGVSPALVAARAALSQGSKGSRSSRELGAGCVWSDWGSPMGKPEWGMQEGDLSKLRKSASFRMRGGTEEPDLSWVQKLVKEGPLQNDVIGVRNAYNEKGRGNVQKEGADRMVSTDMLGTASWIDNYYEKGRGNVQKEGADMTVSADMLGTASWIVDNLYLDEIVA